MVDDKKTVLQTSGFCESCEQLHSLPSDKAFPYCQSLMGELDKFGRIDFSRPENQADPSFSTDYLFGPARGQMFGVMVYLDKSGEERTARAFSGQYNGRWEVPGWVSPIIDPQEFEILTRKKEFAIKTLGKKITLFPKGTAAYQAIISRRKQLSQKLMREIHNIYRVSNFRGQTKPMPKIILENKGIPTGTGDCCAPKLLNFAAVNGYTPLSIAEFFYGKENRSKTKEHKRFYPSCDDKCSLILGFMLCGLQRSD